MRPWSYRGRWALITGASAGLGAEFARQLAAEQVSLVLSARRAERMEELASELRERHAIEVVVVPADLARPGEPARLWTSAAGDRPIDLLVNNAGFGAQGPFHEVDVERLAEMVQVNCTALLELAHAALGEMRQRGYGGIINVASLAAFQPVPNMAAYAATKAFVLSLSEALWAENRDAGVRVLALCPGRTPTEFQGIAGSGDPGEGIAVRSPAEVVAAALSALERGSIRVVPGWPNQVAATAGRMTSRRLLTRVLAPIIRRRGEG